jgi:hypothetical protein
MTRDCDCYNQAGLCGPYSSDFVGPNEVAIWNLKGDRREQQVLIAKPMEPDATARKYLPMLKVTATGF